MGLDFFDIAGGIGAGLTTVGVMKEQTRKENLLQKLELEREERAEQYAKNREDRAAMRDDAKVARTTVISKDGGALYEQGFNAKGELTSERALSGTEADEYNRNVSAGKLGIDLTKAQIDQIGKNAGIAERRIALEESIGGSTIREGDARARYYDNGGGDGAKTNNDPSIDDLTSDLIKDTADLQKQYTENVMGAPVMSADIYRKIAQDTIRTVFTRYPQGKRPSITAEFQEALRLYPIKLLEQKKKRKENAK